MKYNIIAGKSKNYSTLAKTLTWIGTVTAVRWGDVVTVRRRRRYDRRGARLHQPPGAEDWSVPQRAAALPDGAPGIALPRPRLHHRQVDGEGARVSRAKS